MGAKKEALILTALEERRRHAGRHLLTDAHDAAATLVGYLRERAPTAEIEPVGSLRRGCDTCGDLDLLASGADRSLMNDLAGYQLVERVLGQGETKSSVLIRGGFQADLRLVPAESRGAAMQYFTGSKAHNIALRDRAIRLGLKLNEYGLFRADDDTRVAGAREEEVYQALGLAWVPPELREGRGEIEAAAARQLPGLVERADLRGDLHMHTTETDGKDTAARDGGGGAGSRTGIHRHHRPQPVTGDGERAGRAAGHGTCGACARAGRADRGQSASSPASSATSSRTERSISPTTASRRWISSSHRCTRDSTRSGSR